MDDSHNMVIGFVGTGEVTPDNAKQLLNDFFPVDTDYLRVWLPDKINRTTPSLMGVWNLMDTWKVSYQRVPASTIVDELVKATDWPAKATLIALWDEQQETEDIITAAVKAKIEVRDLCDGLDFIEVDEVPEPVRDSPNTERTYGEPREVEAKADGPAVINNAVLISHELYTQIGVPQKFAEDVHEFGHFEAIVRQIVRDEVRRMGLGEHNASQVEPVDVSSIEDNGAIVRVPGRTEEKVKVWTNEEGEYRRIADGAKKAPRGFKTVEVTQWEYEHIKFSD